MKKRTEETQKYAAADITLCPPGCRPTGATRMAGTVSL